MPSVLWPTLPKCSQTARSKTRSLQFLRRSTKRPAGGLDLCIRSSRRNGAGMKSPHRSSLRKPIRLIDRSRKPMTRSNVKCKSRRIGNHCNSNKASTSTSSKAWRLQCPTRRRQRSNYNPRLLCLSKQRLNSSRTSGHLLEFPIPCSPKRISTYRSIHTRTFMCRRTISASATQRKEGHSTTIHRLGVLREGRKVDWNYIVLTIGMIVLINWRLLGNLVRQAGTDNDTHTVLCN